MKQSQKNYIFIFLVFISLWLQPTHAMELTWNNPLSWVYVACKKARYHFCWISESTTEKRIDQTLNKILGYFQLVVGDVLDENDRFARNISQDGQRFQQQFQSIEEKISKLDLEGLQKLITLKLMAARTKKMLNEKLDELSSASQNYCSKQEMACNSIAEIFAQNILSKEMISNNINVMSLIKQKFKDKKIILQDVQKKRYNAYQEQISSIQSQQQKFYRQTKENLTKVKQKAEHIKEECEKEKEQVSDNKKDISAILLQLQNNFNRTVNILNKLNQSNKSNNSKKVANQKNHYLSSIVLLNASNSYKDSICI